MAIVTLTQDEINAGLHSGFSLDPTDQFTFSIPVADSTWETTPGNYVDGNQQPFEGYLTLSPQQAAAFRAALAAWDRLIAPNFVEVPDVPGSHGEVRVAFTSNQMDAGTAGYAFQGSNQTPTSIVGDIWLNASLAGESYDLGTTGWVTLLHEIGHVLGLKHSFEEPPTPPVDPTIPSPFENERYTVMSYTSATPLFTLGFTITPGSITSTGERVVVTTPMVLDIAAIQALYGADTSTRAGNTHYFFTQGDTTIFAIYDAGGIDTFDFSNFTRNNIVDLRPGGYSSIGLWTEAEQIAFWQAQTDIPSFDNFIAQRYATQDAYEWRDNVGIALSTIIENVVGGSGNDTIIGNSADNVFNLRFGGNDNVSGGDGNDGFYFGDTLDAGDFVDGGAGTEDQVALQGNVTMALLAQHLVGIETVALLSGSDTRFGDPGGSFYAYNITIPDAALAAGQVLTINANGLLAGETLTVNASAEASGAVVVFAGQGSTTLIGGQASDGFFFGADNRFSPDDVIVGGAGSDDQLGLRGAYGAQIIFQDDTITGIETIALISGSDSRFGGPVANFSYSLQTHDANVAGGATLVVNAVGLTVSESVTFDGSRETDGRFDLRGGAGVDILVGGAGADRIYGGGGADQLAGGGGADTFFYRLASEGGDTIADFQAGLDKIDVSLIDAVTGGADDAFTFIGTAAFSGTGVGQVRAVSTGATQSQLQFDVDGNGTVDMTLIVATMSAAQWAPADFIL